MNTNWIRCLVIPGLLLASTARTQANDIVDFLRAINGVPEHSHRPAPPQQAGFRGGPGHEREHGGYQDPHFGHDDYNRVSLRDERRHSQFASRGNYGHGFGPGYGRPGYVRPTGPQVSFRVSASSGMQPGYGVPVYAPAEPPVQVLPPVQEYPAYPAPPSDHCVGDIVTCAVPLATCVRVEDECNIAPNAVPIVVAVRDPNMCAHECHERVVFVQVFVPPCPPQTVRVSPCHTRVTLCYGQYEVDIKTRRGMIVVDYDN